MTTPQQTLPPRRKKRLRTRMVLSLSALVVLPLVAALAILFFVVRDDTREFRGRQLSAEAVHLATLMQEDLQSAPPQAQSKESLQPLLDAHRQGKPGRAVLFTAAGQRLAGDFGTPLPPAAESAAGWLAFEVGGEGYLCGLATIKPPGITAQGLWHLALVQPGSEVYARFYSVSTKVGVLLAVFGLLFVALAWRIADQMLRPILEIRRGAEIIARINLGHRIEINSGDELEELAKELNHMAANLALSQSELEERVRQATQTMQEERTRLATVLRTLGDGVIVANEAGEIILMNPRARIILDWGFTAGIGAALSRFFPEERLEFHLNRLRRKSEPGREAVENIIFPLCNGKLLKGALSVVPGAAGELAGFLLVFRDLSTPTEEGERFEETLREMPRLLREPVGTSRSLVESLQRHKTMPEEKQQVFLAALSEEMERLGTRVTQMEEAAGEVWKSRWPVIASNPRQLLEEALELTKDIKVEIEPAEALDPLVLVEPFSWVASLQCVLHWMARRGTAGSPIRAKLLVEDGTLVTSFKVAGTFSGALSELESMEVAPAGEEPLPLGEMVRKNQGELWIRSNGGSFETRLALLQARMPSEVRSIDGLIEGEPEFYDFDLFLPRPVIERGELLQTRLEDLDYVVFDTETTGLQLSQGDKVISISGVRIRRGKILGADIFHTLVNPGRPIPPESIVFHHIEDHMVVDAPWMNEVYPKFVEFAKGAILVAHNAAFDKKALDMAADEAGLPQVDNPFLDTLFLSYGIHEGVEGHSLDAIADRMGVPIVGRHTSLGDARATAQVFLGLLALLPSRGVITLADAKAFCDRHLLLRWQSSRF